MAAWLAVVAFGALALAMLAPAAGCSGDCVRHTDCVPPNQCSLGQCVVPQSGDGGLDGEAGLGDGRAADGASDATGTGGDGDAGRDGGGSDTGASDAGTSEADAGDDADAPVDSGVSDMDGGDAGDSPDAGSTGADGG